MAALRPETLDTAVALADIPNHIRGFGPVKDKAMRTRPRNGRRCWPRWTRSRWRSRQNRGGDT